jgi:DNA polymerase I-like protein with 3'-5' exonuclease and polymerase domains
MWCAVTQDIDTGEVIVHTTPERLKSVVKDYDLFVGHNIIGFDAPVLRQVWGVTLRPNQVHDTLMMSRLFNPILEGGHSLKNWGKIMGNDKINFASEDFDGGLTEEMLTYCKQDVALNVEVYKHLLTKLTTWGHYEKALQLEHDVAVHISRQERNGFNFDLERATVLQAEVADRMATITDELQAVFPPIVEERISEKTGKRLKDKVTRFNVGSRKQIGDRLKSLGWQPNEFTESGQPKIDETVLRGIDIPQAKPIAEYLTLQKTDGFLASWIKNVCSDGKIRGSVITCGTVTNRMAHHSPNLGQVPSTKSLYGAECRSLFIANEGEVLVGADLSGIELRCLAHYMQDKKYTEQILDGDIHTYNQKAAGLPTRDNAKTFIYAFLYGAGAEKLGQIVGKGSQAGGRLKSKFMKIVPSLAKLIEKVQRISRKGAVPAMDGRYIQVQSEHSALNMLLQSAGAIVAKQWIVETHKLMREHQVKFTQVAMVHDEIQASVPPEQAELAGQLMVQAAKNAGEVLRFRIPVDAEYQIGDSWNATH